jgi:hypothetical protein
MIYNHNETQYDITLLDEEGQRAFQLLALAEEKFRDAGDAYVLAQATTVALHSKLQELLTEESIIEE